VNVHSFAPIKEIKRKKTLQKLNLTNFHFSSSRNRLTAVGCDTVGAVSVFDSSGKTSPMVHVPVLVAVKHQ
jgi:hypothetical protein